MKTNMAPKEMINLSWKTTFRKVDHPRR